MGSNTNNVRPRRQLVKDCSARSAGPFGGFLVKTWKFPDGDTAAWQPGAPTTRFTPHSRRGGPEHGGSA